MLDAHAQWGPRHLPAPSLAFKTICIFQGKVPGVSTSLRVLVTLAVMVDPTGAETPPGLMQALDFGRVAGQG